MRIALIADIHANALALEAILKEIRRRGADRILSLGDQVNLGPCPCETLELLKENDVTCLHGNHERYILSAIRGDPAYSGANFRSLHFNAQKLTPEAITFPKVLDIGCVTFCHALPEDDRFPLSEPERTLPLLQKRAADRPLHIVCGHAHNPVSYRLDNLTLDCIGSAGCMDEGVSGMTTFTMMDLQKEGFSLKPVFLPYDPAPLPAKFIQSGMADFCPIMAHIACLQMMNNFDFLMDFVTRARRLSREKQEDSVSMETWQEADRRFPWPDGISTAAFWARR